MGGGSWDPGAYRAAASTRKSKGIDDFDYDRKVRTGVVKGIAKALDPKTKAGAKSPLAGQAIRESRDIPGEHEESVPIVAIFDVTGSMGEIPRILQQKLTNLMDVVIAKAGLKDPQVLVGAVGDAYSDRYPLQVGQFESDNRFDEQLRQIILEGNGGGQVMESYALPYYFAAYHTATDAYEKRGKKGYLITMGDEAPWPTVRRSEAEAIFGEDEAERVFGKKSKNAEMQDLKIEDVINAAKEKWEVFHLFSMDGSYPTRTDIHDKWRKLLGERFVKVDDSSLICEIIAGLIYMLETARDVDTIVADIGLKGDDAKAVKNALVPISKTILSSGLAKGSVPKGKEKRVSGVTRI